MKSTEYSYKLLLGFLFILAMPSRILCQSNASVKEYEKTYTTYPFSDPDPVPSNGKIYPYFRYDVFTDKSVRKSWKIVELENDYIKVQVMPQIGGKIWAAFDKKNGKPFIYNNKVVKFRDIAMRGAWTSGGIETNFGIIGHTPTVATPVNYLTVNNPDGSVSCIISNLDLLTRSRWILEIRLPKDKAYFITHVTWHNASPLEQPYYSWMNLAVKVTDSLQFIDPGTHYIGHDGVSGNWPMDLIDHKNLSVYGQNNFGGAKSYHIFGAYSKYYGAYWPKEDFGMIHYAEREDKLGKKVFLWALSDEGKIWQELLTDTSGQYAEIQSGRLFNQNLFKSSYTPFKQIGFKPFQTDSWNEYWYPFSNTKGVSVADLNGVTAIQNSGDSLSISISAVSKISDTLYLYDNNKKIIYREKLNLEPLQTFFRTISLKHDLKAAKLRFQGTAIKIENENQKQLERPTEAYPGFDWHSAYGLYLLGRDAANQRTYSSAEDYISQSLKKEPSFLPSVVEMATLQYRKMKYDSAFFYAKKALSIDTYDPSANFYYGLAANQMGKLYDALDGFEVASLSTSYRSAAFTEISKIYLRKSDYEKAFDYSSQSLVNNAKNITGLQLQYLSARLIGKSEENDRIKSRILRIDPLNHFIAFEDFWKKKTDKSKYNFVNAIRNELPVQTYLELAIWYHEVNRNDESKAILKLAPRDNEVEYWEAFLNKDQNSTDLLTEADKGNPKMVFPFREETAEVMKWAIENTKNWKPRYYLALIQSSRNNLDIAKNLLKNISDSIDFAPFYIARAELYNSTELDKKLSDLKKAVKIDKDEWRYKQYLASYFLQHNENLQALQTLEPYYKTHPDNYIIGMLYIKSLMRNNQYDKADEIIKDINILPFEGATGSRKLYRGTKLMLAYKALEESNYSRALEKVDEAEEWPRNLGVGKPYPEQIDNDLENAIRALTYQRMNNTELYQKHKKQIKNKNLLVESLYDKIKAISLDTDQSIF
jgi:hypothetical protein